MKFKIKVPATSANIGIGYDCLGVALDSYIEMIVEENTEVEFLQNGDKFVVPLDKNFIYMAINHVTKKYDKQIPNYKVDIINNEIPMSRGLGSSSSAIVAGIMIANKFMGDILDVKEVSKLAIELEGHPDNVMPAIHGGMILTSMIGNEFIYSKLPFDDNIKFYVMIPDFRLSTKDSRKVLPNEYITSDVVSNLSRMGLLVSSIHEKKYENLRSILDDKIHEPYRMKLINNSTEIMNTCKELGSIAEYISGAGPTLASLNYDDKTFCEELVKRLSGFESKWELRKKSIDHNGATIIEL